MGRWEPDARGRLLQAALDLFAEQGYEAVTAVQIAARAGLTKATLFRQFADKREILFQGQSDLVAVAIDGVGSAGPGSTPVQLLEAGLRALCDRHLIEQQEIGRRINALIAVSPDLQERAAYKRAAIAAGLEAALADRLGDRRAAGVLADVGIRAYYDGFDAWVGTRSEEPLADVVLAELAELRSVLVQALGADSALRS